MPTLDPGSIYVDLVFGLIGGALFAYGKKAQRWPHLVTGILLMVYPYFVDSAVSLFSVGALIIVGLAGALWWGY